MVLKVAILDTNALENKGSYGRLVGLLRVLDTTLPHHDLTIFHRYYDVAKQERIEELKKYHPNFVMKRHPWYNEKGHLLTTMMAYFASFTAFTLKHAYSKIRSRYKTQLSDFDVIIDLNLIEPDKFNDKGMDPVNVVGQLFALLSIWNTSLSNEKVMICSATIGPYNNPLVRYFAQHILNKVSLITLREDFSRDYLESIHVTKPEIQVTADLAFLMERNNDVDPLAISKALNMSIGSNAIVGICPAAMMNSTLSEAEYVRLISEVSEFLIEHVDATILYIANTFQDVDLTEEIYREVNKPENTRLVPFSASATDIKSIIGICDLFICSRFHALVGSTSQGVPSIGLVSYSNNKFHGIIGKMMGQEKYLMNIDQSFDHLSFFKDLVDKAEEILQNGEPVRSKLQEMGASTKKQAMFNGYLILDLISKNDNIAGD